jgi:hypothetical protein
LRHPHGEIGMKSCSPGHAKALHRRKARSIDEREILVWKGAADPERRLEIRGRHLPDMRNTLPQPNAEAFRGLATIAAAEQKTGFNHDVVGRDQRSRIFQDCLGAEVRPVSRHDRREPHRRIDEYGQSRNAWRCEAARASPSSARARDRQRPRPSGPYPGRRPYPAPRRKDRTGSKHLSWRPSCPDHRSAVPTMAGSYSRLRRMEPRLWSIPSAPRPIAQTARAPRGGLCADAGSLCGTTAAGDLGPVGNLIHGRGDLFGATGAGGGTGCGAGCGTVFKFAK